jgi:F-type H+-transporting ATPase subunit b
MPIALLLAATEGGVLEGLKTTAAEVGHKFGFNTSLFISQFIGFFIVAFLLQRFAFKPLQKVLAERSSKISESLAAAERMKADLAKADEERKRVLSEAGVQANKIVEEARQSAARITEVETQKAVVTAKDILDKARQASEADLIRMKAELRREVGRLVVDTSSKVTGKILTADDQKRLAEDASRELAA